MAIYKPKRPIELSNSVELIGWGTNNNGNHIIRVELPGGKKTSIDTNQEGLFDVHSTLRGSLNKIDDADFEKAKKDILAYIKKNETTRGTNVKKKLDEATRVDSDLRKKALVDFLSLEAVDASDVEISRYDDKVVVYAGDDYMVLTDDEADEAFDESQENLWDDMGMDSFTPSFKEWIVNNAIEVSKTDERLFTQDIADMIADAPDSYEDRFEQYEDAMRFNLVNDKEFIDYVKAQYEEELSEEGKTAEDYAEEEVLSDLDEVLNYYREYRANTDLDNYAFDIAEEILGEYDSILDYVVESGWYSTRAEAIEEMNIFDVDKQAIFDEIKSVDGRGGTLSSYDGDEGETTYEGVDFFVYKN